jgi:OmpR family two-component system response regulator YxdJ
MNAPVPPFCPCCGADIRLDTPIMLNDFSMYGDGYPLMHKGKRVPLTPMQNAICWTLLKAYPAVVSADVLMIRVGSDAESNALDVQLSRMRAKMRELGIPNPIETIWGKGFRWSIEPDGAPLGSQAGGRPKK